MILSKNLAFKFVVVLFFLNVSQSIAAVKSIGPGFSPPVEISQELAMKFDSQLTAQNFNDLGFSVLLSCVRKGHKAFKGAGRISCVAIGAQRTPDVSTKKIR